MKARSRSASTVGVWYELPGTDSEWRVLGISKAEVSELSAEPGVLESGVLEPGVFNLESSESTIQPPAGDHPAIDTRPSAQILIIEDNPDMRTYIRGHLHESYYHNRG